VTTLADLEHANVATLATLRDPESGSQDLLVQLLTTSCLLELSKLTAGRLDLPSFAVAALEVLTQFAPIDRGALHIAADGLPPARHAIGGLGDDDDQALVLAAASEGAMSVPGFTCAALRVDGGVVGYLAASELPDALAQSGLVEKTADLISTSLSGMIEAERMRRQVAAGRALELVASVDDGYGEPLLSSFVDALAALPRSVAARLEMANARFGGPLRVQAGTFDAGAEVTERDLEIDRRTRMSVSVAWSTDPLDGDVDRLDEILGSFCAAVGRVEQNLRLLEEVETDELTGIGNRRRGLRALSATRSWAEREGANLAVLLMDLDHFKRVNDTLGHDVGDKVLTAFAQTAADSLREYDTIVRWGGEEFLVVCPDTDLEGATALAARLLTLVPPACEPFVPVGWHQTVSIGVAVYPSAGDNPTTLVKAADDALYEAKREGRDRYVAARGVQVVSLTR
jgi:diguanylate cyclase (GGDEF)-like protein